MLLILIDMIVAPLGSGSAGNSYYFESDGTSILVDAGFGLERVLPVDQFLWSPHMELVGVFRR